MICPFCGESMLLEMEWYGEHEWFPIYCCEELQQEWEQGGDYSALFEQLTAGYYGGIVRGVCNGMVDFKLTSRLMTGGPDWQLAKRTIDEYHRHHDAPVGWYYGVAVYNGPTLVGVATVGRPVGRWKKQFELVEVNRACTLPLEGLERHAASKLYALAAQEAKRRKYKRIITYTFVSESGVSLKAAGWEREAKIRGRSWNCKSRPRNDKTAITDKYRWVRNLKRSVNGSQSAKGVT